MERPGLVTALDVTALSLLVCLAGIVSWGRSYEVGDAVYVIRGLRSVSVISEGGTHSFATFLYPKLYGDSWTWEAYAKRSDAAAIARGLWRFEWDYDGQPWRAASVYVVVPQWVVPAVFGPRQPFASPGDSGAAASRDAAASTSSR